MSQLRYQYGPPIESRDNVQPAENPGSMLTDLTSPLTSVQARRLQRIALVKEFGGKAANLKSAAREAVLRGMYSTHTSLGDIESALNRAWIHRHKPYNR